MKATKKHTLLLLLCVSLAFTGCDDDDDKELSKGEVLISTTLPNPDGMSGASYIQLINDLSAKTYDNAKAFPVPFLSVLAIFGDDVFVMPSLYEDILEKYTRNSNGELSKTGTLNMPSTSAVTNMVKLTDEKAYLALQGRGLIWIINPKTMTKTGEIDLAAYGVGDANPDPSGMVIRDGKLYVALNQMVGGYLPFANRPYSDVVIINTATDQVEKMITETTSGISTPSRPPDPGTMFLDENNDIYIVCIGAWGFVPGHKTGVLRIKSGETGFDNSYLFNITDASIEGEANKADYISSVQYVGGGKLYANVNIPAYYSIPADPYKDKATVPVLIDLNARTVKRLNLPRSNPYASVSVYNEYAVFGLITDTDNGFFTCNTQTGQASSESVIKTTGYPSTFLHFGEKY